MVDVKEGVYEFDGEGLIPGVLHSGITLQGAWGTICGAEGQTGVDYVQG